MAVLDVMGRQTLRAREEFLSGGSPRAPVRSDIVASWRRSLLSGADPDVAELPYNDYDHESQLQRSGRAVIDMLADLLDGSTAALLLADGDARIIGRWAGSHDLSRVMDSTCSAPGFSLEETACGTNGLGSVLEERRLFHVTGAEHYAARFLRYSCCGAPIRNPISGRLDGVVTLVCPGEDANRLMAPIVLQAASAIEEGLAEHAGRAERQLLTTFLACQRETRRPVIAINERAVIATPAAARAFDPDQLAVLWEHVAGVVTNQQPEQVELCGADNRIIVCDCRPLVDGGMVHGALVEIGAAAERHTTVAAATAQTQHEGIRLVGRTRGWQTVMHEAGRVGPSPLPLLVAGPPGSGKLELVRSIHYQAVARGRLAVVDAALSMVESVDAWLRHLIDTLSGDDEVVVVRHIDQMDRRMANVLGTVMDHRAGRPMPRVVATITTGDGGHAPEVADLADRFVHRLDVPSLNARRHDIPDIVSALVERHSPGSGRRFSAEALQVLMRADWPRNLRQLQNAVLGALQRRDSGDVSLDDLPYHLVNPSRSGLTPMQQAELEAVLVAMRESHGNKQEAAAALGIARSTLYRKLREFGLDLDRVAY
jgi:transcriptional regulator of acetoin/glycerol metabolism